MITEQDIFNLRLRLAKELHLTSISDSEVLRSLIESDMYSDVKTEMKDGINYYEGLHKISFREIVYWIDKQKYYDRSKANNKSVNPFHQLMVDQKAEYIAGGPVTFTIQQEQQSNAAITEATDNQKIFTDALGEEFNDLVIDWITGSSNKGVEWLHVYINTEGELCFIIVPAEQIIPVYDEVYQKELKSVINYYKVDVVQPDGKIKKLIKAEWWDSQQVTYYIQSEDAKTFILDIDELNKGGNPRGHWVEYNTDNPNAKLTGSWGYVPFIGLKNNTQEINDLRRVKSLIDIHDLVEADFANNLEDMQDAVYVLKGYEGQDLSEFMRNLKTYKAIKISAEEGAGVDTITLTIPKEARDSLLDRLREDIYHFGMGVDMSNDKFGGSPSGIALKFLYSGLDMKAGKMIRKLMKALEDLSWFVCEDIKNSQGIEIDYKQIKPVIKIGIMINETEQIANAVASKGMVSDETILQHHPWVENVEDEFDRLEEQKASVEPIVTTQPALLTPEEKLLAEKQTLT
jgi:SPP1 family phage portal protein